MFTCRVHHHLLRYITYLHPSDRKQASYQSGRISPLYYSSTYYSIACHVNRVASLNKEGFKIRSGYTRRAKVLPGYTGRGTQFTLSPTISGGRGGWQRSCLAPKIVGLFVGTSSLCHTIFTIISTCYAITLNPSMESQRRVHHIDKGRSLAKSTARHTDQGYFTHYSCIPILPICLHI